MKSGTTIPYAGRRTKRHLLSLAELHAGLTNGGVPHGPLARMEARDHIFPNIDYRVFRTSPEGERS